MTPIICTISEADEDGICTIAILDPINSDGEPEYFSIRSDMAMQWAAQEVACREEWAAR